MSPTQRTLAELRKRGWPAQVVEQTVPRTFIKRDLFGCIDIIAVVPTIEVGGFVVQHCRILGIQVTSGSNHSARVTKALKEPRMRAWCEAGGQFEVWSWAKRGPRGKRKAWMLRTEGVQP